MNRFFRYFFGIPLAGAGAAFALSAGREVIHPTLWGDASAPGFFGTICLLGAFFLLRRA